VIIVATFKPVPDRSELSLEAESSLHPIQAATSNLTGFFEAELLNDGQLDLSVVPAGRLEVFIDSLESGNKLIDRETQRRLDMRRFPSIIAEVVEIQQTDKEGRYQATGTLTFHGNTRKLKGNLTVKQLDDRTIEVGGQLTVDVRDFGIEPPKLLMLKVYPNVKAKLKVVAVCKAC
jgi:polyisoprenoid-binding protein YceI